MTSFEAQSGGGGGHRCCHKARIGGLYAIADRSHSLSATLPSLVHKFLKGGCSVVQLRMKGATATEVRRAAAEVAGLRRDYDFTFIVNDFADVALEVGADGVHVGAADEPIASIRKRAGARLIIGYSAHSLEEARSACEAGADYVAFGAIFPTRTKGPGHPVQGVEALSELVKALPIPVVAIGGIGRENIDAVKGTGVSSVAMITALSHAHDIVAETKWFTEKLRS
jgi:thiamine-phosphate pyrophosphorylase